MLRRGLRSVQQAWSLTGRLERSPSRTRLTLPSRLLALGAQPLALAEETLMALELTDNPVTSHPGSKAFQQLFEGLAVAKQNLHVLTNLSISLEAKLVG